jgi:ParB family transcriptional regulator, chromosome partitioning protein
LPRVTRPQPGIGRGLRAILSVSDEAHGSAPDLRELPLELIVPNPKQPRARLDEATLNGLAESVRERGVLQPVLVRPRVGGSYELVAGERRWRAAKIADLATIPAVITERADTDTLELALIENMAREDLSPVEEARACAALEEELGLTREEVGRRVGRSRAAVSNLVRLLDLPDEVLELLQQRTLSAGHGRALLLAEDHDDRKALARRAVSEEWSVRTAEDHARASNMPAPRDGSANRKREADRGQPDQEQAILQIAEALSDALRADVRVKGMRGGGYRAELTFSSPAEALELVRRLRATIAA